MPSVIVISDSLRHDGRRCRPGDTITVSDAAFARLGPQGSDAVAIIHDGDDAARADTAPVLSDLGAALDLVAFTFDMEVQEVCAVLTAHGEQRDTEATAGIAPAPSADGLPPTEGPEAVAQPQETSETGAAAPASEPVAKQRLKGAQKKD